jgi:polysaccharide chain length determinant protein (PEP-CTERM system associated)
MEKTIQGIKPQVIIELVLDVLNRRCWFIIVPFCLAMLVGIYLSATLPRTYRASTLILVQPQRVPGDFVRSIVSSSIDSRIRTISEQIMSRTNLERIINEFGLFSKPEEKKMFLEDKIAQMRQRIGVNLSRSSTFSVSFTGSNPQKVMQVANALATYFIDENLRVREAQALGTSNFLDDELQSFRKQLKDIENSMREYRLKHNGELPEQLDANLRTIDRLQQELFVKQKALRDTRASYGNLERQIAEARQNSATLPQLDVPNLLGGDDAGSGDSPELAQLKDQLAKLQTRYTSEHPDVVRLRRMIEKIEKQAPADTGKPAEVLPPAPGLSPDGVLKAQKQETAREIAALEADISHIQNQIKIVQQRVENTPQIEEGLTSLDRNYGNIKSLYSSLLNRKLEAEISVSMEKKQKGEQFRILDPAQLPEKPFKPNLKRLFVVVLGAGLAVGCGIVFLLEFLDTSIRRPDDIEAFLNIPLLVSLPSLVYPKDIRKKRIRFLMNMGGAAVSLVLLAVFAAVTFQDPQPVLGVMARLKSLVS